MRLLSWLLTVLLAVPLTPVSSAQTAPLKLNLVIVEGEGAINNIRQRTAREPIVRVEDENHKPIAGAAVVFLLPNQGAGGTFAGGGHSLTVLTDAQGRAVARGFRPNTLQGQFQIHVNASYNGQTASTNISQANALGAAGAGTAATAGGLSGKLIAIVVVLGAAAVGGAAYAVSHSGSSSSSSPTTTTTTSTTISAGTASVGPPR